jgi:hypothetical protein
MGFLLVDVVWSPLSSQKKSLLSPLKLMHMGRPAGRPYQGERQAENLDNDLEKITI